MTIYCVARNYALHAKELGNKLSSEPVVFLKADSSLRPFRETQIAFPDEVFHYEGEVVLRVAYDCKINSPVTLDLIDSFALGVDLTRRKKQTELKKKGLPWTVSKSFLGSAIVGQFKPKSCFKDPEAISFQLFINDSLKQDGNLKNMIFPLHTILKTLLSFGPLKKGDLIFTGTPEGVGEIRKGDSFEMIFPEINYREIGKL
jgi:2-keto-4-pentenoate hydratase/2-oxohepta-3-ene-1,7-dioic acid hydratase in catechol pathway